MARNSDLEEMSSLEKISQKKVSFNNTWQSHPSDHQHCCRPSGEGAGGTRCKPEKEQLENFVSDLNHKTHQEERREGVRPEGVWDVNDRHETRWQHSQGT